MKVTYWVCECLNDSACYSIRHKTKKAAEDERNSGRYNPQDYAPATKVVLEYADGFDLVENLLSEGGGYGLIANDAKTI